jgi:mono/diheme cytochrome c family protein
MPMPLSMQMKPFVIALLALLVAGPRPAAAQQAATTSPLDVQQLFATTCGWCHSDGGRVPGKGPQLMNTTRSDDFIRFRIQHGKEGAKPAFGASFKDADIDAIIKYIRELKPEQG